MALIMRMKGSNGISPCRICNIVGVHNATSRTYYVPLRRHSGQPLQYDPANLPIRVHDELMAQAKEVQNAPTKTVYDRLSKQYGIKGVPILATLTSISFPASFPFDFMHLIWENLIPNLILFWTATFKELDHEDRGYVISPEAWKEVGEVAAACKATIPSAFGAPVPNVALQRSQMTSEMYSNWTLFIAPIVLRGRFQRPIYYKHFLRLVQLLKMCLELEISSEVLDQIDEGFQAWVEDYERCVINYINPFYVQLVDRHARQRNRQPEYVKRTFFGQLRRILRLDLPIIPQLDIDSPSTFIYAIIQTVKIIPQDNLYYYHEVGAVEVVDLDCIQCVVGRVRDRNRWAVVDRSSLTNVDID
ncbi:hypothetical protein AGABI2DRAFT_65569 [Agaricus bisporus var. bisporus H97]|uniref:hypothetical protein n=1 Tax=Agaricus bisporus var. bisporus (strain H97 / ATCC MYA-4626 / FGSC 10389) TaxID=936046 RepID=UPI00029F7A5D|nr:hypothetical protein AGABI2DRAFT_65569 [Agaricus bisporus var. bisporus H97]EKV49500.1 hypothetical protein AGABI2DRAFT_65569 [Agaricus bisporus var. bisporus H97]